MPPAAAHATQPSLLHNGKAAMNVMASGANNQTHADGLRRAGSLAGFVESEIIPESSRVRSDILNRYAILVPSYDSKAFIRE